MFKRWNKQNSRNKYICLRSAFNLENVTLRQDIKLQIENHVLHPKYYDLLNVDMRPTEETIWDMSVVCYCTRSTVCCMKTCNARQLGFYRNGNQLSTTMAAWQDQYIPVAKWIRPSERAILFWRPQTSHTWAQRVLSIGRLSRVVAELERQEESRVVRGGLWRGVVGLGYLEWVVRCGPIPIAGDGAGPSSFEMLEKFDAFIASAEQ